MKKYLFDLPPRDHARKPYAAGENTDGNSHNSLINDPAQVGETLADAKVAVL